MADHETHSSRAEQRMAAVAKLKRAASLPRMKDGRRPPMPVESFSEGEIPPTPDDEENVSSEGEKSKSDEEQAAGEIETEVPTEEKEQTPEADMHPAPEKPADIEIDPDTEPDDRPMSPSITKKRRSRSRSRSRGSKDFKGKARATQSPVLQLGGDSSQDENSHIPSPIMLPMVPPLASPMPHFPFLQQPRFLPSPTPVSPDMSLFYPGTSPPTPLPTLDDLRKGLMRSNSAGSSAAGRRMAMHKLTGGTETYDPSPSPTPPPFPKLSRNNTVSGGERIAARQNLLNRLGTRVREADADATSGAEERCAPSPTPKRRRRRSRRTSATVPNLASGLSDSELNSTNPNTPATLPSTLPTLQDHYAELRAQSVTPNQLLNSRNHSNERVSAGVTPPPPVPPPITQRPQEEHERPELHRRRSVLVEDPDEDEQNLPLQGYANPGTPQRMFQTIDTLRKHSANTPSNNSSDSAPNSAVGVSVFSSQRAPSRNDPFPSSPFTTPLKEKALTDEDEEQVLYPGTTVRPRTPYGNQIDPYDREISWVASPVPEIRMPIDDDEDESDQGDDLIARTVEVRPAPEEEEGPLSTSSRFSPEAYDDTSPRASSRSSKSVILESEALPENAQLQVPASPSSAVQPHASEDGSVSPQFFPTRLSIASRIHSVGDRSPLTGEFQEWEDPYTAASHSPKRTEPSTWEKVKNTFTRGGQTSGRRSRTNSIVTRERRDHTDSSVSRESGVSLTSSKTDKGEQISTSGTVQAPPLMQTPSASASILSLAAHVPPRGSVSPIPPASSADMSKYQNAKLFPFPGMLRLEEERRAKGYPSATASSPDVSMQSNVTADELHASPMGYSLSNSSSQTQDANRERTLSHQNSDTRLFVKYGADALAAKPPSPQHADYADVSPPLQNGGGYNLKLPMTLPGVKQWLKNSKKKPTSPPGSASGTVTFASLPVPESQVPPISNKKPSLSDLFPKKEGEFVSDWEDGGMSTVNEAAVEAAPIGNGAMLNGSKTADTNHTLEIDQTPRVQNVVPLDPGVRSGSPYAFSGEPLVLPSPRHATPTPDPSSLSDYPAPTPSESSSTTSSQYSLGIHQGSVILERIEEHLARGFKSPMWSSAIDDPPRKLILSSPVLQVLNPNTVKDRFLFLFNDILVIAKPITYDQDNLVDSTYKPDKKYAVKSVVQLRNLRFCADRSEAQGRVPSTLGPRNPIMRTFISQFVKDPDYAISSLFSKSNVHDNATLLGQLLFRTLELDRTQLGDYLYRRTSRGVLKSYLDSFGFAGLRVDVALRVFLHSANVSNQYALEHLLESFAARWYEANAKFVAYDRDMAVRLVSALVQLNDRLHGGISDEPGPTSHTMRKVTSKEFQDAFRRLDPRYLVSDDLLQELYRSIFHERLCQACPSVSGSQDTVITVKRPLPTRLNLKVQSEPIVLRLPQSDPLLTIELYGQDLIFEPPTLHFSRSSEASFRVTGTSLGSKTITLCRSGPNATKYSGLPLSHNIDVERAFMKNTFQIAFLSSSGAKRKYMFSVDDTIIRNEWATCLRRQIDSTLASPSGANGAASPTGAKFRKAADAVAFKVLQETLMGSSTPSTSPANGSYSRQNGTNGLTGLTMPFTGPLHIRSKSGNKTYQVGKSELDFGHRSQNSSRESNDYSPEAHANTPDQRPDGIVWTSRELEMQCQQNSSIALVLSFLQVGASEQSTL